MRIFAMLLVLVMLCSCSSDVKKPSVLTDGFSCTVTADYGEYESTFFLKKESCSTYIEYISPTDISGLVIDASPAGMQLRYKGISFSIGDTDYDLGLSGALISALDYDYTKAIYAENEFTCVSESHKWCVSVFKDGRISSINFPEFNCKCYFNY